MNAAPATTVDGFRPSLGGRHRPPRRHRQVIARLADAAGVPLLLLLPDSDVDTTVPRAHAPRTAQTVAGSCHLPFFDGTGRHCMLAASHDRSCLPVPSGRGLAVR